MLKSLFIVSEEISTGISAIDALEDTRSINAFNHNITLEDSSGELLLETGYKLIQESYALSDTTSATSIGASIEPLARNYDFGVNAEDIIDFSTTNPFGEVQR